MTENNHNKEPLNYAEVLNQHPFVPEELDYSVLENQKGILCQMASLGNSCISVYDLCKQEHVFYSPNFATFLGYEFAMVTDQGQEFLDSKIHPEDHQALMETSFLMMKLFRCFTNDEKVNYKIINEYRILNSENNYIWVIEQHQVLALDGYGNMWLDLSIIDISPNQSKKGGLSSQLFNFRTGKSIPFKLDEKESPDPSMIALTKRESEILQLVKDGLLSKEISDRLSISVHTVNTHRQRVLEKLGANNSMEAVVFASKYGLLN